MRAFLIALIIALQCLLGYFYFKDYSQCCTSVTSSTDEKADVISLQQSGPLLFNWSEAEPRISDGWMSVKDSILSTLGSDKKLEITGRYCEGETPADLGLRRAAGIRALFPELPDDRIILASSIADCKGNEKDNLFTAHDFAISSVSEKIKEVEDKTLIYFGSNSVERLNSTEVENYLNIVAERVSKSGERVEITGHTDNVGPDATNMTIGLKRAEAIKKYLVSKGVAADKISTASKGESQPISDNGTEEGRAKNRRTELTIIK